MLLPLCACVNYIELSSKLPTPGYQEANLWPRYQTMNPSLYFQGIVNDRQRSTAVHRHLLVVRTPTSMKNKEGELTNSPLSFQPAVISTTLFKNTLHVHRDTFMILDWSLSVILHFVPFPLFLASGEDNTVKMLLILWWKTQGSHPITSYMVIQQQLLKWSLFRLKAINTF